MRLATLTICLLLGCNGARPEPTFSVEAYDHARGHYVAAASGECNIWWTSEGFVLVCLTDALSFQLMMETDGDWENGYAGYDFVVRCDPDEAFCSLRYASDYTTCRPGGWGEPVAYIGVSRADGVLTVVVRWPVELLGDLGPFAWDFQTYRDGLFQLSEYWRGNGVSMTSDAIDFSVIPEGVPVDAWSESCGDRDGDGLLLREYAAWQNRIGE